MTITKENEHTLYYCLGCDTFRGCTCNASRDSIKARVHAHVEETDHVVVWEDRCYLSKGADVTDAPGVTGDRGILQFRMVWDARATDWQAVPTNLSLRTLDQPGGFLSLLLDPPTEWQFNTRMIADLGGRIAVQSTRIEFQFRTVKAKDQADPSLWPGKMTR